MKTQTATARASAKCERTGLELFSSKIAFTLIELLVVIAIIGILAGMLLPALAAAKMRASGVQCMANGKTMSLAFLLYVDDYRRQLPYNTDGGNTGKGVGNESWVAGWETIGSTSDNTNTDMLIGNSYVAFGSIGKGYVSNFKCYKCPNDKTKDAGTGLPRVRTISMNGWMNPAYRKSGSVSTTYGQKWFGTLQSIPVPSDMFVTLDERVGSINDAWFAVGVNGWTAPGVFDSTQFGITDWPANYHNNATSFSFADGHMEIHKWGDKSTIPLLEPGAGLTVLTNNTDVQWLMTHATSF